MTLEELQKSADNTLLESAGLLGTEDLDAE